MNNYRIFETEQFQKDLKQIALSGRQRITQKLGEFVYPRLREHPHFGPHIKKLKGIDLNSEKEFFKTFYKNIAGNSEKKIKSIENWYNLNFYPAFINS